MLLLNSPSTVTVDGVTVFPDHVDKNQFWYLPGPVALARRGADHRAQFTFIGYRAAVPGGGEDGGGFLMFEVDLALSPKSRAAILSAVRPLSDGDPRLTAVAFDTGTVRCVALDLEGEGGTAAPAAVGGFRIVEQILGARKPSLTGDNAAAFSLQLSKAGATIVRKAFEQGVAPVGVIFDLTYTGLQPALNVVIEADLSRILNHFSAAVGGQYAFLKGDIEVALDFLKQTGAITITVQDFTTAADKVDREKWALDFFKENLLKQWFEPTFTPPAAATASSGTSPVDTIVKKAADAAEKTTAAGKTATPETGGANGATRPTPTASERANATLTIKDAGAAPGGIALTHRPADTGTIETVRVSPSSATVTVGGKSVTVVDGTFTVDVASATSMEIEVSVPGSQPTEEVFNLFFEYDRPTESGFSVLPPSSEYRNYISNSPVPADTRFLSSRAPSGDSTLPGAEALREWVRNRVASPKILHLDASASFEGHVGTSGHNQGLSERRLKVTKGIIDNLGQIGSERATGESETKQEPPERDPQDRVCRVRALVGEAISPGTVRAAISRPETKKPIQQNQQQNQQQEPNKETSTLGAPSISFKLKFAHTEEDKKLTVRYNRSEAAQRTYAPQGFFGLLLDDLPDKLDHFVEVDLDDPFFRAIEITAAPPTNFGVIGLQSAQVAIEYGDSGDPENFRHADFVFTASDNAEKKTSFFLNQSFDTSYRYNVEFHFDPNSGWLGQGDTIERPTTVTTDRTLLLNPHEDREFLSVEISPNRMDPKLLIATDVAISHQFGDGTEIARTIRVTPTSSAQHFNVRTDVRPNPTYTYHLTHRLVDGSTQTAGPFTSGGSVLPVDDPFSRPLEIDVVSVLDPASRQTAIVDIEYDDDTNNYHRAERVILPVGPGAPTRVRLSLVNPELRSFRFRTTVTGPGQEIRQSSFTTTSDTLVVVQ